MVERRGLRLRLLLRQSVKTLRRAAINNGHLVEVLLPMVLVLLLVVLQGPLPGRQLRVAVDTVGC